MPPRSFQPFPFNQAFQAQDDAFATRRIGIERFGKIHSANYLHGYPLQGIRSGGRLSKHKLACFLGYIRH